MEPVSLGSASLCLSDSTIVMQAGAKTSLTIHNPLSERPGLEW